MFIRNNNQIASGDILDDFLDIKEIILWKNPLRGPFSGEPGVVDVLSLRKAAGATKGKQPAHRTAKPKRNENDNVSLQS